MAPGYCQALWCATCSIEFEERGSYVAFESLKVIIPHEVASELYKRFLDSVEMRTLCKKEPKRKGQECNADCNGEGLMPGIRNDTYLSALRKSSNSFQCLWRQSYRLDKKRLETSLMQRLRSFSNREASFIADKDMKLCTVSESAPPPANHRNFLESEYICTFLAVNTGTILIFTLRLVTSL